MNMLFIRHAWQLMRENPLVSAISVIGTALSVAMALVVVITFQVDLLGFRPESNRSRMLYMTGIQATSKSTGGMSNASMSVELVRECLYTLTTPERVTAFITASYPLSLPGKKMYREYRIKYTDAAFWDVFDFRYTDGKPFTEADFTSAIPRAVVASSVARSLFGQENPIGKGIIIADITYTITGVVEDVSDKASNARAEIWLPYTTSRRFMAAAYNEGITGYFRAVILARSSSDFSIIKEEMEQKRKRYVEGKSDYEVSYLNCPLTQMDVAMGGSYFNRADMLKSTLQNCSLLLLLLLIPALNLIGFVMASVRKRRAEVGIRKAFGATKGGIIRQMLYENLLSVGIGAIIGILLSFLIFRLKVDYMLTAGMLIKPVVFIAAILFAILLNLFSAGIPAAHIARRNIIRSIKDEE
jgi:putative ABC transport system permease protein